jgi:hypothetical protein
MVGFDNSVDSLALGSHSTALVGLHDRYCRNEKQMHACMRNRA